MRFFVLLLMLPAEMLAADPPLRRQDVKIKGGVSLHVIEMGRGEPIVFVHGLGGECSIWERQLAAFASQKFRAIAYSRRYNSPNKNRAQPNHSAAIEAADLEQLLTKLGLRKVHLVGHSYGAYTSLLFALRNPDRIRTLTLAEPPIVGWLKSIRGANAVAAKKHHERLFNDFLRPAKAAFTANQPRKALRVCIDYFGGKGAYERLPKPVLARFQRNIPELKALTTSQDIFPPVSREAVKKLKVPVLLLSGGRSTATSRFTDAELNRLLPNSRQVILKTATHIMWVQQPRRCRDEVLKFIRQAK